MNEITMSAAKKRTGLIESAFLKLFARDAKIVDIEDVGTAFRIVTLGGNALYNIEWTPCEKIQILLSGWTQRTDTPIEWNSDIGRTRILVYLHCDGPGARWARTVQVGDKCVVFGPRTSLVV